MDTIEKYDRYVTTRMVSRLEPIVIDRAHGALVQTPEGKEYIDCFAGIAVVNAGHVHPKVAAAAKAQIDDSCTRARISTTCPLWPTSLSCSHGSPRARCRRRSS